MDQRLSPETRPLQATLGAALAVNKGFGRGFDALRVSLALSVLLFHSFVVVGRMDEIGSGYFWLPIYGLLPMFFALSGFLITASALRLNLRDFLLNRGLRIVPALGVEITISALVIGPLFTTWALWNYFSDSLFASYFLNIVGYIHYRLPGVFETNPSEGIVNLSLWTIPYEIICYFIMSAIIITGLAHRPRLFLGLTCLFFLFPILIGPNLGIGVQEGTPLHKLYSILFASRGSLSLQCFLAGSLAYLFRDRIPLRTTLFVAAIGACTVLALWGSKDLISPAFNAFVAPLLTYITVFVGVSPIPKLPFFHRGDYSYGIYLYGYPIQQSIVATMPWMRDWFLHFVISVLVVTCFAVFSWHFIEKPILLLRKKFSFVGRRIANESGAG